MPSPSPSLAYGAAPSRFLSTCQAGGRGGRAQKGGVSVPGAVDGHSLPGSDHRNCLLPGT